MCSGCISSGKHGPDVRDADDEDEHETIFWFAELNAR